MKKLFIILVFFVSIQELYPQMLLRRNIKSTGLQQETIEYLQEVADIGGTVNDTIALDNEIKYAKSNGIWSKIAYWIDKDFGEHIASSPKIPLVVFDYDDGRTNNFDSTYPAFVAKGTGRPSFNLSGDRIGKTENGVPFAPWSTIQTAYADGVEMNCHGYTHALRANYSVCTDQQIIDDMYSNDTSFVNHGLPKPIHHIAPGYYSDFTRVTPIIARYRKSIRVGSAYLYYTFAAGGVTDYNYLCWLSYSGYSIDYSITSSVNTAIAAIKQSIIDSSIFWVDGHSCNKVVMERMLDSVYLYGVTPKTIGQAYTYLNSARYKLFNVAKNNYEAIAYFDHSLELTKQGLIIFNDSLKNINTSVADHFLSKNYHVSFLNDTTDGALDYMYPSTTKLHNGTAVTVAADDRVTKVSHGLLENQIVYFTADVMPDPLVANTDYYINRTSADIFKLRLIKNGSLIDITSTGTNVKLYTHSINEVVKKPATSGILKSPYRMMTLRSGTISVIDYALNCTLSDLGLIYIVNNIPPGIIYFTNNALTGAIPIEFKHIQFPANSSVSLSYNQLSGGLENLYQEGIGALDVGYNLFTGAVPTGFWRMKNASVFHLNNNAFSGTITTELARLTKLTNLKWNNNAFTDYQAGAIATTHTLLKTINLSANQLPVSAINQILIDVHALQDATGMTGTRTLTITQSPAAAPTGAGATAKTDLQAHGWTVNTD